MRESSGQGPAGRASGTRGGRPSRPAAPPRPPAPAPPASVFPWAPPPDRGPAGREALTREQIVDSAIRLLDEEGLGALSMRRLGQELGAGATSLYWHIRSKDELLDLVLDRVIGEVVAEVPVRARDWRTTAADTARTFRRVLLRHRHVTPIMGARPTLGPNSLRGMDTLVTVLRSAGFAPREAFLSANTIVNWAAGFTVFECRSPLGPLSTPEQQAQYLEDFNAFLAALSPDEYPMMVEMAQHSAAITADAQFDYGLERLLDGIEAHARHGSAG